jgi:hypothetical protein
VAFTLPVPGHCAIEESSNNNQRQLQLPHHISRLCASRPRCTYSLTEILKTHHHKHILDSDDAPAALHHSNTAAPLQASHLVTAQLAALAQATMPHQGLERRLHLLKAAAAVGLLQSQAPLQAHSSTKVLNIACQRS